jgi:2-methylisocitrate lyase-like PEP mutase family enzyme
LLTATDANRKLLAHLKQKGTTHERLDQMTGYSDFSNIVGLDHYHRLDDRFGVG